MVPFLGDMLDFGGCDCVSVFAPFVAFDSQLQMLPTDRSMGMFFSRCGGLRGGFWNSLRSLNGRDESCLLSFFSSADWFGTAKIVYVCVCEESLGASWGHQKHLRMWICSTKSKVTFPYITMAILILMGGISSWRAGSIFDPFMWPVHLVRPKHHSRLGLGEYQNLGNTWCRMFDSCFGTLKPLRSSDILLVYRILLKKWYILTECYVYWGVYVRIHM